MNPAPRVFLKSEEALAGACLALLDGTSGLSLAERRLIKHALIPTASVIGAIRAEILAGGDLLGEALLTLRPLVARRAAGAIYTPSEIVQAMFEWLASQCTPARIVDPGAGSGRFTMAAAMAFPNARLVAVELDPLAALVLRANLTVHGWMGRARVLVKDYRSIKLPRIGGATAFVGNPPYVRHHDIPAGWKAWYVSACERYGIKASALAGLHLHFFLQTRRLARPGDLGAFITAAEWLDVNYGRALRRLVLDELGGTELHVFPPTAEVFAGVATTAAITCFRVGEKTKPMLVHAIDEDQELGRLGQGVAVTRERLRTAPRWTPFVRPSAPDVPGRIELGELFRVHRGQVTGANDIWIAGEAAQALPDRVKLPAVTRAKDLIEAGSRLGSADHLRRVVDLPAELDDFTKRERERIAAFLAWAKSNGADRSYIARHRKSWWSVGLRAPAPILCTYMARRPPQFTLNTCGARHINIAHGLYPREELPAGALARLVTWLNSGVDASSGRVYAGGLAKFEPREIERLRIPSLEDLLA